MRIQHNIAAMNSYRNYNVNTNSLSKNLEKLSSGYRINRAGDDAAGLAISEKMRAQISGLKQAQSNVKDGISLVKTAEGALQEVQDMMNRMVTLATQSANGTYDNDVDRANLQKEVEALKNEIDRIADSANFNGTKLLDGSLDASAAAASNIVGEAGSELQDVLIDKGDLTEAATTAAAAKQKFTNTATVADNSYHKVDVAFTDDEGNSYSLTLVNNAAAATGNLDSAAEVGTSVAGVLGGTPGTYTLSSNSVDAKTAYEKFQELFSVTDGADGTFTVENKDKESTATVTSISVTSATSIAGLDSAAATGMTKVDTPAIKDGKVYGLAAAVTAGKEYSITVGGKEYTAKAVDTDQNKVIADLVKQMKADGINAIRTDNTGKADANGSYISLGTVQEAQKGVQIVNTAEDKWTVAATGGDEGQTVVTLNAPTEANAVASATVKYLDAEGNEVTKTFEYNTGDNSSDADDAAAALEAAMKEDADFAATFSISVSGSAITLKNNGSGVAYGVQSVTFSDKAGANVAITEGEATGKELTVASGETIKKGDQITVDGKTYQFVDDMAAKVDDGVIKVKVGADNDASVANLYAALKQNGVEAKLEDTASSGDAKITFADNKYTAATESENAGLQLQIGDTAEEFNQITVSVQDMHVDALGIGDLDISKQEDAAKAIDVIKAAINTVSATRGDLGAIQNRLEHTTNNLSVMTENIQDAESTIRDTDIADEMTTYTKNNILLQSAQAMLAQANQMPQGVLQLLQ